MLYELCWIGKLIGDVAVGSCRCSEMIWLLLMMMLDDDSYIFLLIVVDWNMNRLNLFWSMQMMPNLIFFFFSLKNKTRRWKDVEGGSSDLVPNLI